MKATAIDSASGACSGLKRMLEASAAWKTPSASCETRRTAKSRRNPRRRSTAASCRTNVTGGEPRPRPRGGPVSGPGPAGSVELGRPAGRARSRDRRRVRARLQPRPVRRPAAGAVVRGHLHRRRRRRDPQDRAGERHLRRGRRGRLAPAELVRFPGGDEELRRHRLRPGRADRGRLLALGGLRHPGLGDRAADRCRRRVGLGPARRCQAADRRRRGAPVPRRRAAARARPPPLLRRRPRRRRRAPRGSGGRDADHPRLQPLLAHARPRRIVPVYEVAGD